MSQMSPAEASSEFLDAMQEAADILTGKQAPTRIHAPKAPPPGTRLVTILAFDPDPGRVDRARMGRRNPADTEPRPEVPPEDIEATRAELAELRRRMTRKNA